MAKKRIVPLQNAVTYDNPEDALSNVLNRNSQKHGISSIGTQAASTFRDYDTGLGSSKYDENISWNADIDENNIQGSINEYRAQEQSDLAKTVAGIGRIGTKAVSEIAKIPGVVGGIIAAPFAEEGEGWETAFNNQWIKSISQFNEDINTELLPVYVKKAVSEGDLMDNISSIDFWATEGADGIGFIASMLAPGAALKGLNLGHKILGTTAKGLSMINGETKLAGAVRTLEGLGITAKNIDLGAMTMANTLIESGSEAGSAMNSFQKDLDKKLASGEIDQFQYEQLQTQKAKLGRDIFVSNLAILLVPNAIQTKMIWGKGVGSQLVKDTPSLMTKIGNRGKNVLGALGSEGFLEEGTQSTVETMFTNKAKRGELTDDISKDFNISELASSYIDTLNTTDGQKAIFLGGVLGGGMSAYQGAKSDIVTRKETQDVLSLAEEKVGVFNRINETDVYRRNTEGDIIYNSNNQPQYDPVKVRDVAKALNYSEEQSQLFDQAIQEGNEQVIQTLKNQAINQLITPFINKGELGIQALSQYLDTTLTTEEISNNEDAKTLKSKILEQATYMQDQLNTYKDFSKSLINLNNPNATPQDTTDYYNMLGDLYINLKGSEYFQKGELKKLNIQKSKLLKELGGKEFNLSTEIVDENAADDIFKFKSEQDPRVKLLNEQIEEVNKNLSEIDKIINDEIWNNEKVNESFNKRVKENNKLREEASPEQVAKNDAELAAIASAKTEEELEQIYIKEGEIEIINDIKKRISEDPSLENLQNVLEIVKNSNFTNFVTNNLVKSIEDTIKKVTDDRSQFEEIVFEIAEKYSVKNKQLVDKLTEVENRISKLIESKEGFKKSLSEATGKSKNKLLRKLVKETQSEIDKIDSEIKKLESEKTKLLQDLESIDKNLDYLYTRLEQINKVGFTSIEDIIKYLDKNKDRFGEHRFDIARLSTQQFYTNQNVENIENLIDYLEDYKVVLEQTIKDYLAVDEEHSQDLYYLQRELEDSIDELAKLKKELPQEKEKLLRLNKALNNKLAKQSLDSEIEFWNKLQKYKESKKPNPVIQQKVEAKKAEIVATEEAFNTVERDIATQEDNDFNNVQTYDGLTATEGSIVTDELIPQENENNTVEELNSIKNSEVDNGLGVKVISTDRNTGLPLQFISEQFPLYLEYEREPVDKSGKEVGFEINQNPGKNPKVLEALNAFNNKDFSNPKLLIDFLPINVQFTNEVKAPIETRRVTNDINISTLLLRTDLVNNLIKGVDINDIKTTIQDQYKGLLKIDENRFANNNILKLDGVKDINYIRENLYVVNSFGKLQNILNDKIFEFNNGKIKPNAAGEIYLTIPQANGKLFPLKLNIKKINEGEAYLLYEIYKEIITNEKSLDTTISEVNNDLQEAILTNFEAELSIIGGNKNDIKLQEIVDLLIYQSSNIKSRMEVVNGNLYFGDKESTIDTIEQDQNDIIDFLISSKRHQIKINPKSETDNTKTNLKSNSADYLKYLIDNNILSTNAVVNEPTFQGYTNIYLNTGITITNQPKVSESGVEVITDNTGFENLFENKSENVRNIENNFVSLSEIPGTVENTELKETQDKVFNEKRTPKQRQTDFRRMDVLFKKKQEGTLTTEKELRDFEMFKQMYPQEYEKRCK